MICYVATVMPARLPFPLLHVHLGPGSPGTGDLLPDLARELRDTDEVRQSVVSSSVDVGSVTAVPDGLTLRALVAVGRALGELAADPGAGRRAVQWPVPERWAVVHAHGAAALRAVWLAAAWRGSGARVVATPTAGDGAAPAGLWRKAELVAVPDGRVRESLARRGVERRRLRAVPAGDAESCLRLYRRLAAAERRRTHRIDWSVADGRDRASPPGGGAP